MVIRKLARYRLRTLLILATIVGAVLACRRSLLTPYRKQQEALIALKKFGRFETEPAEPVWLRPLLGETFYRVEMVRLEGDGCTDAHFRHLRDLAFVKRLYLEHGPITDDRLRHVGALQHLQRLSLRRTRITDDGLKHLASLKQLKVLDIDRTAATHESLANLPASITQLVADERVLNAKALPHLPRFAQLSLNDLDLSHQGVKDGDIGSLCSLNELGVLSLRGNPVTDAVFSTLKTISGLREVDLSGTNITHDQIMAFSAESDADLRCTYTGRWPDDNRVSHHDGPTIWYVSPEELKLRALCWLRRSGLSAVHDEDIQSVLDMPLAHAGPDWPGVRFLPMIKSFTELNVRTGHIVKESNIYHLGRVPHLRKLVYRGQPGIQQDEVADWWLLQLSSMSELQELRIVDCLIEGWSLVHLAHLPRLKVLDLSRNPLVAEDLAALGQLGALRDLSLRATPLTDEGLRHLYPLTRLEKLDIRDCSGVSPHAVKKLRQRLPNTRIVYE